MTTTTSNDTATADTIARLTAERDFLLARAARAGSTSFSAGRWTGVSSNAIVTIAFGGEPDFHTLPADNGDLAACYRTMMRLPPHLLSRKVWAQLEAGEREVATRYDIELARTAAGWTPAVLAALKGTLPPEGIAANLDAQQRLMILTGRGTHSVAVSAAMQPLWFIITKHAPDDFSITLNARGLEVRALLASACAQVAAKLSRAQRLYLQEGPHHHWTPTRRSLEKIGLVDEEGNFTGDGIFMRGLLAAKSSA